MHRRRRPGADREAGGAHARRGRPALRGGRAGECADPGRPPPPPQPDPAQGGRDRALGRARSAGRRDGQRGVLQARQRGLLRRPERVAAGAGWRPDPDQHDPRDRQPARDGRRDRGGAGVRVERDARLRGRGHRRDQPALRERRAGDVPAVGHRRGARRAGSRPRRRTRPTRPIPTRTRTRSSAPSARSACRRCGCGTTSGRRIARGSSRSRRGSSRWSAPTRWRCRSSTSPR